MATTANDENILDTNIIIHREASTVVREEIGVLFNWLDRLHHTKCIHRLTISEISKHKDPRVVGSLNIKLKNYHELKTEAPDTPEIAKLRATDTSENDKNDTSILKEIFANRADCLITEDRRIHAKAKALNIADRVFSIDNFLEKVTAENPELKDYSILSVKKELFGNINVHVPFFNSFRRDYPGFDEWFNRKADETVYICSSDKNELLAFLYVKQEGTQEPYADITPTFPPKRRLKIGTFKVAMNGFKLGERFLKIVFDNAMQFEAAEIYVTIFEKDADQERLISMLSDWGFVEFGIKAGRGGEEKVFVRDLYPRCDPKNPATTYPSIPRNRKKFIVSIYPQYHTELLPDSILRTESPLDFVENRPNRNAIRKVYISRSIRRDLQAGDIVIFYRTASGGFAHHTSVATTLAIVESVVNPVPSLEDFIRLCRKRSVFTDAELKEHWNYRPYLRPFIVNFLYVHSLPKRPNLAALKENRIIEEAPRGFDEITDQAFNRLIQISNANNRLIVD